MRDCKDEVNPDMYTLALGETDLTPCVISKQNIEYAIQAPINTIKWVILRHAKYIRINI